MTSPPVHAYATLTVTVHFAAASKRAKTQRPLSGGTIYSSPVSGTIHVYIADPKYFGPPPTSLLIKT